MYWGWSFVNFEKRTFHVKVSFFGGQNEKPNMNKPFGPDISTTLSQSIRLMSPKRPRLFNLRDQLGRGMNGEKRKAKTDAGAKSRCRIEMKIEDV